MQKELTQKRLTREFEGIKALCKESRVISYEITKLFDRRDDITIDEMLRSGNYPPLGYIINYEIKSIVGIDSNQIPIIGDFHQMEIDIPENYPIGKPRLTMKTEIWHPNIKSHGHFRGKICSNPDALGFHSTLAQLILKVGETLQYKNYFVENRPPYPEDQLVAEWVVNFAEPNNIVNQSKGIYIDYTDLIDKPDGEHSKVKFDVQKQNQILVGFSSNPASEKNQIIKKIRLLISEASTKEAIECLLQHCEENNSNTALKMAILQSSMFQKINMEKALNIINHEQYSQSLSKINLSILDALDNL